MRLPAVARFVAWLHAVADWWLAPPLQCPLCGGKARSSDDLWYGDCPHGTHDSAPPAR